MSYKSTPRLSSIILRVPDTKIEELKYFYSKVLGMNNFWNSAEETIDSFNIPQSHPNFPECYRKHNSIDLKFLSKPSLEPYQTSKNDLYWKIGLALNDVNAAVNIINKAMGDEKGAKSNDNPVQPGKQFLDIGFVTHLNDPCGFTIELLQTTFENNNELRIQLIQGVINEEDEVLSKLKSHQPSNGNKNKLKQNSSLLASQPYVIGQITTRITDPEKSLDFYTNVLKMKLLSIQEVKPYCFTLYFLGYTQDNPPKKDDLKDVKNREWLWQQKYTTLELQWRWDSKLLCQSKDESAGLDSIEVEIGNEDQTHSSSLLQTLKKDSRFCPVTMEHNMSVDGHSVQLHGIITDPDGLKFKIISKTLEKGNV